MTARDIAKVIFEGLKSIEPKKDRNIIAIAGPPGSGKSTIGKLLSLKLGILFYDSDREIEKSLNKMIHEIFQSELVNIICNIVKQ